MNYLTHPLSLFGMKVIESSCLPYRSSPIQLSEHVNVSHEFRRDFNEWANNIFGSDVNCIQTSNMLVLSPEAYAALKLKHENNT